MVIMVAEMTGSLTNLAPAMAAAGLARLIVRRHGDTAYIPEPPQGPGRRTCATTARRADWRHFPRRVAARGQLLTAVTGQRPTAAHKIRTGTPHMRHSLGGRR